MDRCGRCHRLGAIRAPPRASGQQVSCGRLPQGHRAVGSCGAQTMPSPSYFRQRLARQTWPDAHARPHIPQWSRSFLRFRQTPSPQSVSPCRQTHWLSTQVRFAAHVLLQMPQCRSVSRTRQRESQQVSFAGHSCVQPPQLLLSDVRSVQIPPQQRCPAAQHFPLQQSASSGQTAQFAPHAAGLVLMSTQKPLQFVRFCGQEQIPPPT